MTDWSFLSGSHITQAPPCGTSNRYHNHSLHVFCLPAALTSFNVCSEKVKVRCRVTYQNGSKYSGADAFCHLIFSFLIGPGEIVFPSRSKHSAKKTTTKKQQKYVLEMDRLLIILMLIYVKWLILSLSILHHVIFSCYFSCVILQCFFS